MNNELFYMNSGACQAPAGCPHRLWKRRYASLLLVVGLQLSVGCSEPQKDDKRLETSNPATELIASILQTARATAGKSTLSQPDSTGNAFIHPDEVFEFWMYLAILRNKEGDSYAFQQRFARIKVAPDVASAASEWHYSTVVAVDFQFDALATASTLAQRFVEREALDLAGADPVQQRVWSGAYSTQRIGPDSCRFSASISVPQLQLLFSEPSDEAAGCANTLTGRFDRVAGLSVSRSGLLPVKGHWVENGGNIELDGYGWVVRGWGLPPDTTGAAVVFDRAWLLLEDQQQRQRGIQLQRSRRASGRGPEMTTATTTSVASVSDIKASTNLSAQLADGDDRSDSNLPTLWHLQLSDLVVDINLSPVEAPAANVSFPGAFWFGVVAVNGSHNGYGFIEYSQP